jgi:glucokinase
MDSRNSTLDPDEAAPADFRASALPAGHVIGVDVGGTKCAGGVVMLPEGSVLARQVVPTAPHRGGLAVLSDVIHLVGSLQQEVSRMRVQPIAAGIGVAELVDTKGRVRSEATIGWRELDVPALVSAATSLPTHLDADVRAAARAEAVLGAGRGYCNFLYITVGTGISGSLVLDGQPTEGARGLFGTFASARGLIPDDSGGLTSGPPLEDFSAGPAIARRMAALCPGFAGTAVEVLSRAESGDEHARAIVHSAGRALGAAMAHLVNLLDPEVIVIGGGLGLAGGSYRTAIELGLRDHVWAEAHRDLPLLSAALGSDAGWIGAALGACPNAERGLVVPTLHSRTSPPQSAGERN